MAVVSGFCEKCGGSMRSVNEVEPEGTRSLYGGIKTFDKKGKLTAWYVCVNLNCEDGSRNTKLPVH